MTPEPVAGPQRIEDVEGRPPLPLPQREPITLRAALALLISQGISLGAAFGLDLTGVQVAAVNAFVGTLLLVVAFGFPRIDSVLGIKTARGVAFSPNTVDKIDPAALNDHKAA